MQKLIFATGNPNKVFEVRNLLGDDFEVGGLQDIGCTEELPETTPTILGNALQKARFVFEKYGVNCFSEDTGLEIDALGGEPGVYSARYAGEEKDPHANMDLVLRKMDGIENRRARFRTVIALLIDGQAYTFEGVAEGTIEKVKSGTAGFGYDPIFRPEGAALTFAQMNLAQKNAVSHRAKAIAKLISFLKNTSP
jgi:XTP/dITP diphosphohydrolase